MTFTQGSYALQPGGMSAHYKDLRELYAKRMECHGMGMALMQPISGEDCMPPCCGYFDRNGDWNLIARISTEQNDEGWVPLEYEPAKSGDIGIEWQPKTALGVRAITMEASGESPDNLPGGAEGHIKYHSRNKFGAVLMTMKPITLHAYNDERLFLQWLENNRDILYLRYGNELKKYGLWIATRTYNSPGASINAWLDNKKDAVVSAKAKANMLGEIGNNFNMAESMTDRDWSHYRAKSPSGLVVFMDGIEVPAFSWWKEGVRVGVFGPSRPDSQGSRRRSASVSRVQSPGRREKLFLDPEPEVQMPRTPPHTPPQQQIMARRTISRSNERPLTLVAADDDVLIDAGLKDLSRSASLRRVSYAPSLTPSNVSIGTPSLRRETRSISREKSV